MCRVVTFLPVRYGSHAYPAGIEPMLDEVPAHFDIQVLRTTRPYSMHTEYAAGPRRFDSPLLSDLDVLGASHSRGVPRLWTSVEWAREFATFVLRFAASGLAPSIIEVHPPFSSYCKDISTFLDIYESFDTEVRRRLPEVDVVIENRFGSRNGGRFRISTVSDLLDLNERLAGRTLALGIALDLPQLLNAESGREEMSASTVTRALQRLAPIATRIRTVHIWGRRRAAHVGTLDDLVGNDPRVKEALMQGMLELFGDGRPRLLVPEVNSGQGDFTAIIEDLQRAGFHI